MAIIHHLINLWTLEIFEHRQVLFTIHMFIMHRYTCILISCKHIIINHMSNSHYLYTYAHLCSYLKIYAYNTNTFTCTYLYTSSYNRRMVYWNVLCVSSDYHGILKFIEHFVHSLDFTARWLLLDYFMLQPVLQLWSPIIHGTKVYLHNNLKLLQFKISAF